MKDYKEASRYLNESAVLYWKNYQIDQADSCFRLSMKLNEKVGNDNGIAMIHSNLGMMYADKKAYAEALSHFMASYDYRVLMKDRIGQYSTILNIVTTLNALEKYDDSINLLLKGLVLAREMNDVPKLKSIYGMLSETYEKKGDINESQHYFGLYKTLHQLIVNKAIRQHEKKVYEVILEKQKAEISEQKKAIELINVKDSLFVLDSTNSFLEREKITLAKEKVLIQKESNLKRLQVIEEKNKRRTQIKLISVIVVGLLVILLFAYIHILTIRSKSKIITDKNAILEQMNKEISSSINYASCIQRALLDQEEDLLKINSFAFLINLPKNIVSGDFFWKSVTDNKIFLVVADCTGHGVPGAFVSLIGAILLDEIINKEKIEEPSDILNRLHEKFNNVLRQKETQNTDGMDLSLCVFDLENRIMKFSGAHNPVLVYEEGEKKIYKGNRLGVGGIRPYKIANKLFSQIEVELRENQNIYMFSDGVIDQFDKNNVKKYTLRRWVSFLQTIQHQSFIDQKTSIENEIKKWKDNVDQIDDIIVLGFSTNMFFNGEYKSLS
ncbi:SpoIIE family protein phosphatase (plasmid) [Flammeovirga sp. MY04]|uniref:SpoIIE family protein phosphatase n=1 Tax=Flammeovirga sp. MY04 TaxID=1191459 RepID=UPI00130539B9|nr:SpoIIE family protein phosphatase [Flammeovirga sp. MY04]ANQ52883.2 SpoIIE family protein phosphatase [Flammeovirga sp. MY04]